MGARLRWHAMMASMGCMIFSGSQFRRISEGHGLCFGCLLLLPGNATESGGKLTLQTC